MALIETLLSSDPPAASTVLGHEMALILIAAQRMTLRVAPILILMRKNYGWLKVNEEDPGILYFVVFFYDLLTYYVHKDNTASRCELIATNQLEFTIEVLPTQIGCTQKSQNMDKVNECLCDLAVIQED